jgi:hypothetical protein
MTRSGGCSRSAVLAQINLWASTERPAQAIGRWLLSLLR